MPNNEPALKIVENPDNFLNKEPVFEEVKPLLEPPLEITRDSLRLLNVVDETIIVHDPT